MATNVIEGSLTVLDKGATFTNGRGSLTVQGKIVQPITVTAVTAATTLTAATVINGLFDCAGSGPYTLTLDTAALILAAQPNFSTGISCQFWVRNRSGGTLTVAVASGITSATGNTLTVADSSTRGFILYATSASAITVYSMHVSAH